MYVNLLQYKCRKSATVFGQLLLPFQAGIIQRYQNQHTNIKTPKMLFRMVIHQTAHEQSSLTYN